MLPWFAAFAACAIAMTVAMTRFMAALVDPEPSSNARWLWGLAYGLTWIGIIYYIQQIPAGEIERPIDLRWLSVLGLSGWTLINALWLIAWFAIGRARERSSEPAPMPRDSELLAARAKRVAQFAATVLAIAAWNLRLPHAATAAMFAPGARSSSITLITAGIGFAMFMAGGVRLALYSGGSKTFTVTELRDAWRGQLWRRDSVWLSVSLMFAGVIIAIVGGIAGVLVIGGATERTVIVLFVAYGVGQMWRGVRRRRR